jgi:hypothetical protein
MIFLNNLFFYGEVLLAPCPTTKLEDHPYSIYLHLPSIAGGHSSIGHYVVRGTHLTWSTLFPSPKNSNEGTCVYAQHIQAIWHIEHKVKHRMMFSQPSKHCNVFGVSTNAQRVESYKYKVISQRMIKHKDFSLRQMYVDVFTEHTWRFFKQFLYKGQSINNDNVVSF